MKAVVMAGGEGTRLRPLTSNQPKPMVSIVGKPCMEHIVELLREHGFEDVVVTLAFLPQAIRSYFGSGETHDLDAVEAPAFIGNYCRISPGASVGPYSVLSNSVTLRERARTARTVIDSSTYVGRSCLIEGAIVGRSCDIRAHVRIHEGVAIGDEVVIGAQSVVMPGVRIYPYKEVESG